MSSKVLVPFDGSEYSEDALKYTLEEFPDGELVVLTVIDPSETNYLTTNEHILTEGTWDETAENEAQTRLERAREIAGDREITTAKEIGRAATAIVEFAEAEEVDHIVLGSRGRTGLSRILLGSVAESVLRRAPVPVTVVR